MEQQNYSSQQQVPPPLYQTPPPKKKKGCLKIGLIILAILIMIAALIAIFRPSFLKNPPNKANGSHDKATSSVSASIPSMAPLGTAVENGKVSLTINSSFETTKINADNNGMLTYTADEGSKYIVINVTIKNIAKDIQHFNSSDFQLYTSDGTRYSPSILVTTGDEKYITFESFNPGIEQTGNIAFNVPEDMDIADLHLTFQQFATIKQADFLIQ